MKTNHFKNARNVIDNDPNGIWLGFIVLIIAYLLLGG